MANLKIITGEQNVVLRSVSEPIKSFDKKLRHFAKDLIKAMDKANGLGIAAPQVGENLRIFVVTLNWRKKNQIDVVMVNPEIVWTGEEVEIGEEGCLSLPGIFGDVPRFSKIKVEFQDLEGGFLAMDLRGLDARVVQHEMDHLNGILFIDKALAGSLKKSAPRAERE